MVQTFLQVAAGAADSPVTRLLGQSPAGLSATGDSDPRNTYDMIAARQAIDLRPQLERLDRILLRSAGVDPAAVSFDFRPLWQMDAASAATIALQKAQATQIYAGLNLWPKDVTARLVESQLIEDGVFPGAEAIFGAAKAAGVVADRGGTGCATLDFDPAQPRGPNGRWTAGGGASSLPVVRAANKSKEEEEKEEDTGGPPRELEVPGLPRPSIGPRLGPSGLAHVPFVPAPFPAPAGVPPVAGPQSSPLNVVKPAGIPTTWIEKAADKNGGVRWTDPNNSSNFVRVDIRTSKCLMSFDRTVASGT